MFSLRGTKPLLSIKSLRVPSCESFQWGVTICGVRLRPGVLSKNAVDLVVAHAKSRQVARPNERLHLFVLKLCVQTPSPVFFVAPSCGSEDHPLLIRPGVFLYAIFRLPLCCYQCVSYFFLKEYVVAG
jgi:hypothetical protein